MITVVQTVGPDKSTASSRLSPFTCVDQPNLEHDRESFVTTADQAIIKGLFISVRASCRGCSTVRGPDRGSVYQACSVWPCGLLGCWACIRAGCCYVLACDDLLVCPPVCLYLYLYLFERLFPDSLYVVLSNHLLECLGAASLDIFQFLYFFKAFPPDCQRGCSSSQAVSLSSAPLPFVILPA